MNKKLTNNIYSFKYATHEYFSQNKFKLIICGLFCFVGLLTGILTAIKLFRLGDIDAFEAFNAAFSLNDLEEFSSNFFGRFMSYELVSALLIVFSLTPPIYIFGWCLLAYRAFLLSVNCTMIVMYYSFNGVIKSLLILLPCQLVILVALCMFFCYMCRKVKINKFLKEHKFKHFLVPFLVASAFLTFVNLIETLLLLIFKSSIILVI